MYNHVYNPLQSSLDLGFIEIQFYALSILTGILVALYLGFREVKKLGLDADQLFDAFTYGLIFGILGARAYYVIYEWDHYKNNVITALYIWNGGMAIHGTIIAVGIFVVYYTRKHKINVFQYLEVLIPGFMLAQAFGRWGNFFNQEAHGPVVPGLTLDLRREFLSNTLHLPDFIVNQMYLFGPSGLDYYHPTFFYEMTWNVVGFAIMFFVLRNIKKYWVGEVASFYMVWYSIGRFFIEGMRTDSLMLGSIRVAQLISIVLIIAGVTWFFVRRKMEIYPVSYKELVEENKQNV